MNEQNKNNPGKIEKNILSQNKIPGCDQLTRPEEIKALSKYLGSIKKVQEEHTTLQKDNLEVPGRTTGRIPKVDLPDFVDPLSESRNKNKAKIYTESSRIPLEKNNEPAELNNAVVGLDDSRDTKLSGIKEKLEDTRKEKIENYREPLKKKPEEQELERKKYNLSDQREINLDNKKERLEDTRKTELDNKKESLSDKRETELEDHREKLNDSRETELGNHIESLSDKRELELGNYRESLSDKREIELEDHREKLNDSRETELGNYREKLKKKPEKSELSNTREKLDFGNNLEINSLENSKEALDFGDRLNDIESLGNTKEPLNFGENFEIGSLEKNFDPEALENNKVMLNFGENFEIGSLEKNFEPGALEDQRIKLDFGERLGDDDNFVEDHKEPLDFGNNLGDDDNFVENHREPLDFGNNLGDDDNFIEDHREPLNFGNNLGDSDNFIEDHKEQLDFGERLGDGDNFVEDHREPLDFGNNLGDSDNFVEDHREPLDFGNNLGDDDNFVENHREPLDFGNNLGDSDNFVEDYRDPLNFGNNLGDNDNFVENHRESLDFGNNLGDDDNFVENHRESLDFGNNLGDNDNFVENHRESLDFGNNLEEVQSLEDFIDEIEDTRNTELPNSVDELPETDQNSPRQEGDYNYFTPEGSELYTESIERPGTDENAPMSGGDVYNYFDTSADNNELYTESIERPEVDRGVENYISLESEETRIEIPYTESILRPDAAQDSPRQNGDYNYVDASQSKMAREIDFIHSISDLTGDELYNKAMEFMKETEASDWEKKVQSLVSSYLSRSKITPDKALEFEMKMGKEIQVFQKTVNWQVGEDADNDTGYNKAQFEETFGSSRKQKEPVNKTGLEDLPPMKLPTFSVDSLNINNYLRYVTEKTVGQINNNGIREVLIQETLAGLVWARDELERATKSDRGRLPGNDMGIISDLVNGGVSGALDNLGNRLGNTVTSLLGKSESANLNNPVNRPDGDNTTGWENVNSKRASQSQIEYTNSFGGASAIYEIHKNITNQSDEDSNSSSSFWETVGNTFLGKSNKEEDYSFSKNYLKGAGIKTTLEGLSGVAGFSFDSITSIEDLKKELIISPYVTTPSKFGSFNNKETNTGKFNIQTLDSDAYWEIILDPLISKEANGGISYLPGFHEINIRNIAQHGVNTGYNRWIPFQGFDLQKSKMTNKTLQLYDGEISYPVSMEFTNELRITIADDQYKSWRTYFEQCAKAAVYNSEGHDAAYYATGEGITAIDTSNVVIAMYKNITFRCQIFIMTPQYSTIHKYDLLLVMKDFSEEHSGSIDGGASDLTVSFSIVGENPKIYDGDERILQEYKGEESYRNSFSNNEEDPSLIDKVKNAAGSIVEHGVSTAIGLIF